MKKAVLLAAAVSLVAAMLLAVAACGSSSSDSGGGGAATVSESTAQVMMKGIQFSPSDLTIKKGTTVTWSNDDSVTHTVTSSSKIFDSGNLEPGKNFGYTFNEAGTFDYSCTIHASMKGKVTVTE